MSNTKKPAIIESKQEDIKTTPNNTQNTPKVENSMQTTSNAPPLEVKQTDQLAYIKNKRAFNAFKKLVKQGKYISARTTAQALGVSHQTILSWSNQKSIIEAMSEETDQLVNGLKQTNSPQGYIYLLEKIAPTDKTATANVAVQIVLPTLQDTSGQVLAL